MNDPKDQKLTEWDFDIPRDNRFQQWPLKQANPRKIGDDNQSVKTRTANSE
jgi:hypothetical protein